MTGVTVTPLASHRNERPYPFCPGCGHGPILDALDRALVATETDPSRVVIVSDIGCSGLSDQYFATSAFHGLHGRSITYATGIKLARPDLHVVVIMGDGGTGIGGAHLINAARRNIGLTTVVMNNLNFGMTGGQHSSTTPYGALTSTTPGGNLEHPLDICGTAAVNGAAYVYRGTSFDDDLDDRIAEAMATPGFGLLDVWELCTAYYVRKNRYSRRGMEQTMQELGLERGRIAGREVEEFAVAYRAQAAGAAAGPGPAPIEIRFASNLEGPLALMLVGAAGGRVRSAAVQTARAAIASGLWAAQRDDYPITVRSGHSISDLLLSPDPVGGVERPADAAVVVAPEGAAKAARALEAMGRDGLILAPPGLDLPPTPAVVRRLDPKGGSVRIATADLALAFAAALVATLDLFPIESLSEAAASGPGGEKAAEVVETGRALAAAG
jgi:pyruvate/2-oxoacid:ferredoxin oxidoreductase beta subunit/Pyruvate/2-oxoacid:ferredoxin oxidoreductase gamma subunit